MAFCPLPRCGPLAALLVMICALPVPAQDRYRDWQVTHGPSGCVATVGVGLRSPASGLVTIAVFPRGDGGDVPAVMTMRVPLGVHLASGIAYSHPDSPEAVGLAWQSCDAETCLASGGVSAGELTRLKAGLRIFVAFRPLPESRALIVPVSLLGFTRAWDAVQSCG